MPANRLYALFKVGVSLNETLFGGDEPGLLAAFVEAEDMDEVEEVDEDRD